MNLEDFYVGADKATELGDESLEVSLLRTELGEISLPSKLVGFSDPAFIGPESLLIETPADKARVVVTEADVSDEQDGSHYRVAYLSLLFSDAKPVEVLPAVARDPQSGDIFNEPNFIVDAGLGSFFDANLTELDAKGVNRLFDDWCDAVDAGVNQNSTLVTYPEHGADTLAITSSGWGDGVYPVLQTLGSNGEILGLHLDYLVVGASKESE